MFGANQPEALLIPPWGVDDESNRSTGYCAQKWVDYYIRLIWVAPRIKSLVP